MVIDGEKECMWGKKHKGNVPGARREKLNGEREGNRAGGRDGRDRIYTSINQKERKTKKRTMRDIVRQKERKIEGLKEDRRRESGGLTGNSAEVEVVSDDLLVVVVHWALGEAQVEVVPQILVNHPPWKKTWEERGYSSLSFDNMQDTQTWQVTFCQTNCKNYTYL